MGAIEETGREIGRELVRPPARRPAVETVLNALTALGFAPRIEHPQPRSVRYLLRNCPYRDAVRENSRRSVRCTEASLAGCSMSPTPASS